MAQAQTTKGTSSQYGALFSRNHSPHSICVTLFIMTVNS
jgi:hypothetical protein